MTAVINHSCSTHNSPLWRTGPSTYFGHDQMSSPHQCKSFCCVRTTDTSTICFILLSHYWQPSSFKVCCLNYSLTSGRGEDFCLREVNANTSSKSWPLIVCLFSWMDRTMWEEGLYESHNDGLLLDPFSQLAGSWFDLGVIQFVTELALHSIKNLSTDLPCRNFAFMSKTSF